jgi:predicted RND superfamily exporter protein
VDEIIRWVLLAIAAIFGGGFLFEKAKASRATKRAEKAEGERNALQVIADIQHQADKIKDDLVVKQNGNDEAMEEVIQSIEEIPETEEVPLSDKVKKLAADQSNRARARAKRVPD